MVLLFKNVFSSPPCALKGQGDRTIEERKADQLAGFFGSGQKLEREIDG